MGKQEQKKGWLWEVDEEYQKALKKPYIEKPLAYALYQVWRKYDKEEKGERGYSVGDFSCSACGRPNKCYSLTDYCPNCGARMVK